MHRRGRLAVGFSLVAIAAAAAWLAVLGAGDPIERGVAAADVAPPPLAIATVDETGAMRSAEPGWHAARVGPGAYELTFPGAMRLAVGTWSAVADVTTRPVSPTSWLVTFEGVTDDVPLDSGFTFLASPAG